jgi:hypothetical protein
MWGALLGGLGKFGSTIGRGIGDGAKFLGRGVNDDIRKIGSLDIDGDGMSSTSRAPILTPAINPSAPSALDNLKLGNPSPTFNPPLTGFGYNAPSRAGNLSQAAGIPAERPRAGNLALAAGVPDTGGGVMIARPAPSLDAISPDPASNAATLRKTPSLAPPMRDPLSVAPPSNVPSGFEPAPLNDYRGEPIQNRLGFQRDQFVREGEGKRPVYGPDGEITHYEGTGKYKRSLKDSLLNAGLGFLQGAASDPNNPLAAGLGGAAAGGFGTAISPMRGREFRFSALHEPRIQGQMQQEQQETDRLRQQQMQDTLRRRLEAQARMDETKVQFYPEELEMERMARERQLRAAIAAENRALREPLQKPQMELGKNRKTGAMDYYDVLNPASREQFEPYVKPVNEREIAPFASSPLGIYDKRSGQITAPAPQKPQAMPTGASTALRQVMKAKSDAEALWATAKQHPVGSAEYKQAALVAQEAQQAYNSLAESLGQMYGDHFEAGPGQGGWSYVKQRQQSPTQSAAQPRMTVSMDAVRAYAAEKGITEQEALQRFRNKGINAQ